MCPDENSEEIQLSQWLNELAEEVARVYDMPVDIAKENIQRVLDSFKE
jgi:hypothetical protein